MKNSFDKLNDWVNNTEGSLVNFLTAFAPWLAPIIPSFMTYYHMLEFLHFPPWIAMISAILVEILGFGTVSTALDFYFHNRRAKAGIKRAPLEVVIGVFVFYLSLILVSNVVIDLAQAYGNDSFQKLSIIIVRALLTLQTIPGALIVAVRTGHRDLLRQIKIEKEELESSKKVPESSKSDEGKVPKEDWRRIRPKMTLEDVQKLANLSPDEIRIYAEKSGYTYKTISNWRTRARAELGLTEEK